MIIEPTNKREIAGPYKHNIYKVTKKSGLSGKQHSMEIALDYEDFMRWHMDGVLIQSALPYLTADEREFMMTGITPEEWEAAFGES